MSITKPKTYILGAERRCLYSKDGSSVTVATTCVEEDGLGLGIFKMRLDAYRAEKKRLEEERQAIISAGGPKPPPIDEEDCGHGLLAAARKGGYMGEV
ncbi:hypothetical protein PIB30_050954 [Stylosanthes scabra]|uniref:Uncharacterized protein n=1 Tax=Stylosanthes scabra TaxID=79078 RepID=A0ABU6WHT4_9FABA|nr:hypothetical protein [Stylosanthes scabra]